VRGAVGLHEEPGAEGRNRPNIATRARPDPRP
jgi:hypothetical protein